jgi:hypothetical protein
LPLWIKRRLARDGVEERKARIIKGGLDDMER